MGGEEREFLASPNRSVLEREREREQRLAASSSQQTPPLPLSLSSLSDWRWSGFFLSPRHPSQTWTDGLIEVSDFDTGYLWQREEFEGARGGQQRGDKQQLPGVCGSCGSCWRRQGRMLPCLPQQHNPTCHTYVHADEDTPDHRTASVRSPSQCLRGAPSAERWRGARRVRGVLVFGSVVGYLIGALLWLRPARWGEVCWWHLFHLVLRLRDRL